LEQSTRFTTFSEGSFSVPDYWIILDLLFLGSTEISLEEILALGSNINSEVRRKRWMIAAKPPITMIQPSYLFISIIHRIHRKDGARKPATFQVLEQFPKCAGMGQAWGKITTSRWGRNMKKLELHRCKAENCQNSLGFYGI
jgi:hypothetical protein